jgi:DNA-binding XRE family transcriptional regulator
MERSPAYRAAWSLRPTADVVRPARKAAGLSQTAAADLISVSLRAWQAYEAGDRAMPLAAWELFLLRTDQHPSHQLVAR